MTGTSADVPPDRKRQRTPSGPETPGGPRVLLAEDEVDLRGLLTALLTNAGNVVTQAASAPQAVEAVQATPFDVIVTDLLMPGGGAYVLVDAIRSLDPEPPVLLITGADDDAEELLAGLDHGKCLRKPFRLAQILDAMDELLQRAG